MGDNMIVTAKVKEFVKGEGCKMGGDFPAKLDSESRKLVKRACERVKGRGQKTVKAIDL